LLLFITFDLNDNEMIILLISCGFMWKGVKKKLVIVVIGLVILTNFLPSSIAKKELSSKSNGYIYTNDKLDIDYIYNITKALSNIIFTEYDEENGEIAKGRAYGTKGEHKAAEILYENMTKLGLYTKKEQLRNLPSCPTVVHKIEILEYGMTISNGTNTEKVDCHITLTALGPRGRPFQVNHNFSYKGLKVRHEHPKPLEDKEDYVLIYQSKTDRKRLIDFFELPSFKFLMNGIRNLLRDLKEHARYPHYKGRIHIDSSNETFDMPAGDSVIPRLYINGSVGTKIRDNIDEYTVDFYLKQRLNKSVVSYNVIGQLNGTDPSKTVIVGCLYDCWWNQGTADSGIGMAIVMGIAKYFVEHNITPKYNIKFVGFAGEEYGMRGSIYYEAAHRNEDIEYVIDLNQLGFNQTEPRLTLQVAANSKKFLNEIWPVVEQSDYVNRTGNVTDIEPVHMPKGHISDDHSFATKRPWYLPLRGIKTVCFLKNGPWPQHHRDGMNHTEGDVLKYFDREDVNVTGEMILNVVKYLVTDW